MGTAEGDERLDWQTAPQDFRKAFDELKNKAAAQEKVNQENAARLAGIDRRERFNELKAAGGDAVADVALEDFGVDEQLTPTVLQAKALEKGQARAAAELALAKAMDFDSVETFRSVLESVKTQKAAELQGQTANAAAASAGQGMPEAPKSPSEAAQEVYKEARTKGLPQDDAAAAYVNALIQGQLRQAAEAGQT